MCGLAGLFDPKRRFDGETLRRQAVAMADQLAHRGPDDAGCHIEPEHDLALGFRRLSILDLTEAGHQPMVSHNGRLVMAFNGEIYNAAELRADLEGRVGVWRGHSDTEVLLEAFAYWGVDETLRRLIGMFAIALFDRTRRELFLMRDRLGKKPLYITRCNGAVLFASQLRCFLTHPLFDPRIDAKTLAGFIRFGWVQAPAAIYQGTEQLQPGCLATIECNGEIAIRRYWSAEDVAVKAKSLPLEGSDDDILGQLETILTDAVSQRMIADVPLGAFLSGGIDSSLVVALMQKASDKPVKTFSIGFSIPRFDEAQHARAVASHLGTEHHELYLSADDALATIPELSEHWDEPFADPSQIPTLLVARMARQHVTVALSGDGGDELFGGYDRYDQFGYLMRLRGGLGPAADGLAAIGNRARAVAPAGVRAPAKRWLERVSATGQSEAVLRYRPFLQLGVPPEAILLTPEEKTQPIWNTSFVREAWTSTELCQIVDTLTYLPSDILTKLDRASMAVGLEARAPLLDHRVFEFAWRLPPRFKRRGNPAKRALRELLYRNVPPALVDRPKMGFGVPIGNWLKGPLRGWAEELLDPRRIAEEGLFDAVAVRDLWRRYLHGETWHSALWCILMFQAWRRRWLVPGAAAAA